MAKKVKQKDNPLQKEYGVLSNSVYVLGKIRQYAPQLFILMLIGMITNTLMRVLWNFIGKFVLDIVSVQAADGQHDLKPLLTVLAVAAAVELVCMLLNTLTNTKCGYGFLYARFMLIKERMNKVMSVNYQHLEEPDVLDMNQRASNATGGDDSGVNGMMSDIYTLGSRLLTLFTTLTAVLVLDFRMVIAIVVLTILQYLFFLLTVKKDRRDVWYPLGSTWRKIYYMDHVTQDFEYAKDIRLFGMKRWLAEKQHEIRDEKRKKIFRNKNLWIYYGICSHSITMLSSAIVYAVLIRRFLGDRLTIGNFTLYIGLAATFTAVMTEILNSLGGLKQKSLSVDDFRSFLAIKDEEENCLPLPAPVCFEAETESTGSVQNANGKSRGGSGHVSSEEQGGSGHVSREEQGSGKEQSGYRIEFRNVSFRYKGQQDYAVKHLNLTLEPGKRLAVVGLNGAGKTTMIKLLMRLYDPTEGEILLNGVDIRRYSRRDYCKLFAPIFQNVEIFAFPMNENVSMATPEETDKEKAFRCMEQAGLGEKIASLKQGADTQLLKVLYDDGVDLSGGEKQKLALARALYKDSPIIVLDEPTAALDALAEYKLYKEFDSVIGNKTAVYISHRLSSTRFCDVIAMFADGELVEYGSHEELLKKGGAYAEMFEIQAQYYRKEA